MANDLKYNPTEEEVERILNLTKEIEGGIASCYSRVWIRRRIWWILEILQGKQLDLPAILREVELGTGQHRFTVLISMDNHGKVDTEKSAISLDGKFVAHVKEFVASLSLKGGSLKFSFDHRPDISKLLEPMERVKGVEPS